MGKHAFSDAENVETCRPCEGFYGPIKKAILKFMLFDFLPKVQKYSGERKTGKHLSEKQKIGKVLPRVANAF